MIIFYTPYRDKYNYYINKYRSSYLFKEYSINKGNRVSYIDINSDYKGVKIVVKRDYYCYIIIIPKFKAST